MMRRAGMLLELVAALGFLGWFAVAELSVTAQAPAAPAIAITQTNPVVLGGACAADTVATSIAAGSGTPTCATTVTSGAEITWTPSDQSGAGLTFTSVTAFYTKFGRTVVAHFELTFPATASGAQVVIGGLPFTARSGGNFAGSCIVAFHGSGQQTLMAYVNPGGTNSYWWKNTGGATLTNANMATFALKATCIYVATT